jgi:tetratricopeptide (TPR) repeat protein
VSATPGRNEPCPCGSGRKYKHCCGGRNAAPKPGGVQEARAHLDRGIALAQAGDDDGALSEYGRAAQLDPTLAEAHGRAGDVLQVKKRLSEAAVAYERATAAAPGTGYGLLWKAKGLAARGRTGDSEQLLKQLVQRPARGTDDARAQSEAHVAFGHGFAEAGRFDEAEASFARAIELSPAQTTGYYGVLTGKKITQADRPVVEGALRRLEASELAPRERMMLHFAVGKAFDDLRDYAAAIGQFDAANVIRRTLRPFDPDGVARLVDRFIARYTPAFFADSAALGKDDETPVFVLGMPRSGTTLFERILSSHGRVAGAGELPYWMETAPAWVDAAPERLAAAADRVRGDYLRVLRAVGPQALRVTDKTPANFMWIGLVHTLLPKARFVHCRRSAVDTCLSIYFTHFATDWAFAGDRGDLVAFYRQYERLMAHWRAVIPADRLLDVDYEDATQAPEPTARRLVDFCGLPWDDACLRPESNAETIRTASRWQARQPVYRSSVDRWRNYEPWLGALRELLPAAGG